jgi:hypothetical protein
MFRPGSGNPAFRVQHKTRAGMEPLNASLSARSPCREGLGQPSREHRRPTRSDRCPHHTRQGSYCFRLSQAPVNWIAADIVRIEAGKLVEHWDVIQDEATKEQSKSGAPLL